MKNGNGTKLTLWISGAIIFPTLAFMGTSVIANDRIRQDEDKEIRREIATDRKDISVALAKITNQLASIETELRLSRGEATNRDDRDELRR